jgi:hypothetical protein
MADYDYTSNIWTYLRYQYNSAVVEGATAYIYIYSDRDPHCVRIRKMVAKGQISGAFEDVRVTMLNYNRLLRLYRTKGKSSVSFYPADWGPALVKIAKDGGLTDAVMYPDLYLFHTDRLVEPGQPEPPPLTPAALESKLRDFFQSNDEI